MFISFLVLISMNDPYIISSLSFNPEFHNIYNLVHYRKSVSSCHLLLLTYNVVCYYKTNGLE